MNIDEVIAIFIEIAGISEAQSENYRKLCENAVRSLKARLKTDIDLDNCGGSFERAAAALAFIRYVQKAVSDGEYGSFKVGQISIGSTESNLLEYANSVWEDSLREIKDYLNDDEFIFRRIL